MNASEKKGLLFNQRSLFFALPFNKLYLQVAYVDNIITAIDYTTERQSEPQLTEFGQLIARQLEQYFKNSQTCFSVSCQIDQGTPFQQKVWRALTQIPPGKVKTYGALASELNSSPRAIGNACRNNLFPLVIPCHRVVSASGIGGYAGDTIDKQKGEIEFMQIKQWLLTYEQAVFQTP